MKSQFIHIVFDYELASGIDEQDLKFYYNEDLKSKRSSDLNLLRLILDSQENLQDKLTKLIDESLLKMTTGQQKAFAKSEIFEKSPYKNDLALEFFKSKVIMDYVLQNRIERVVLHGPKKEQACFFMDWCAENSVCCEVNSYKKKQNNIKR